MAYGWFSPIKGSYPGMTQEDKTAPFAGDATARSQLARGSILKYTAAGFVFAATGEDDADLYVALQDGNDRQAEFAGTDWYLSEYGEAGKVQTDPNTFADGTPHKLGGTVTKGPAITGLSLRQSGEYQTSVFDKGETYAVGDKIVVKDGGILTKGDADATSYVGIVTKAVTKRYLNDKAIDGLEDRNQGAMGEVLQFRTAV